MNRTTFKSASRITFGGILIACFNVPFFAHADCAGSRCVSYDYTIPVTITTSGSAPAFTVNGGNVGVGTTAPAYKLTVAGGTTGALLTTTDFAAGTTGSALAFGQVAATGNVDSFIQDANTGGTVYGNLYLNPSGGNVAVGTGTTPPAYPLDVGNSNKSAQYIRISGQYSTGLIMANALSNNTFSFYNAAVQSNGFTGLGLYDGSTYRIQINNTGADVIAFNQDGGNVGIGTNAPGYVLDVHGDVNSTTAIRVAGVSVCTSSGCTSPSDERLKKEIVPLNEDSLTKLNSLKAVEYKWKDQKKFGPGKQIGLIAQEVEKVYPEIVRTSANDGMKSIDYARLVVPLLNAVSELSRRQQALEKENAELATQIKSLSETK